MQTICGTTARAAEPPGEIDLAESTLAEQPFDPVLEPCFRAADDLSRRQQIPAAVERKTAAPTLRVVAAVACFNMGSHESGSSDDPTRLTC